MGKQTGIAWCDATWNPWQGCHHVSPGCEHCYMFSEKTRYGQDPDVVVRSKSPTFNLPFKLKPGSKVFTCSWSDFFIKEADPWRDGAWRIMEQTPHLTYLILTKRIERVKNRLPWRDGEPWPHVWLIVSVEDQETADRRLPILLECSAAVLGVSYEPALQVVDFSRYLGPQGLTISPQRSMKRGLNWIIIGGESGPEARPFDLEWARSVIHQCHRRGVACFVKQLGSKPLCHVKAGSDGQVELPVLMGKPPQYKWDEPEHWPEDLRVQRWPA